MIWPCGPGRGQFLKPIKRNNPYREIMINNNSFLVILITDSINICAIAS